ncbi:MAG: hypothetical protein AAFO01_12910 [Pseudomonadota bacterium]
MIREVTAIARFGKVLANVAHHYLKALADMFQGAMRTWADLHFRCRKMAAELEGMGVAPGSHVLSAGLLNAHSMIMPAFDMVAMMKFVARF